MPTVTAMERAYRAAAHTAKVDGDRQAERRALIRADLCAQLHVKDLQATKREAA